MALIALKCDFCPKTIGYQDTGEDAPPKGAITLCASCADVLRRARAQVERAYEAQRRPSAR